MKLFISTFILCAGILHGGEAEHLNLAKKFAKLDGRRGIGEAGAETLADILLERVTAESPGQRKRLVKAIVDAYESDKYLEAEAKVYAEMFSEDDLSKLVELAKMPIFQKLESKKLEISSKIGFVSGRVLMSEEIESIVRGEPPIAEQGGAGQPATRPELDSENDDKPQPESEGRSR